MDLKKTTAPVNTITYNKNVIEEPTGNVYEAITIIAKRANQINSEIKKELIEKGVLTKEGGFIGIGKTTKLKDNFNLKSFENA